MLVVVSKAARDKLKYVLRVLFCMAPPSHCVLWQQPGLIWDVHAASGRRERFSAGGLDGGRWRIGYAEHARACKSVRVLLSSFYVLRGAALPRAVELSPDGMGPVRIGVTAQATATRSGVCLGAR